MKNLSRVMMVAIAAVVCVLCGCSQDDDIYDNSDMYTLAEEMGTRSMGGDPGGTPRKRKIVFKHTAGHFHHPKNILDSTDPTLYGEYDTDTLTVSISNFVGHASISIVQGTTIIDSMGTNVAGGVTNSFPLAGYTTGVGYEIDVALSDSSAYVGLFDL